MTVFGKKFRGVSLIQKACLILIAGLFLYRAPAYAPDTEFIIGGFSSDTAIPILMANSDYFSPFSLYYWGQDRFGSWPFLAFRALGNNWDYYSIYLGMYIYLHLGFMYFFRNRNPLLLTLVLLLLHFWRPVSGFIFDIAQPYGWQLGTILFALGLTESRSRKWHPWLYFLLSFLGIWLSPSSALYLLGYPFLKGIAREGPLLRRAMDGLRKCLPVFLAYWGHGLLRRYVVQFNGNAFYQEYETPLRWKLEYIGTAWKAVLNDVLENWELAIWIVSLGFLLSVLSVFSLRNRSFSLRRQTMSVALLAASALFLLSILPLNWFTLNQFGARYLALPRFLIPVGLILFLWNFLKARVPALPWSTGPRPGPNLSGFVASLILLIVLLPCMPERKLSEPFEYRQSIAADLESKYPGLPLIGNYWETYVYAALQRTANIPQPGHGQYQRTPFLLPDVLAGQQILVNHEGLPATTIKNGIPLGEFRFRGQIYVLKEENVLNRNPRISLYAKSSGQNR